MKFLCISFFLTVAFAAFSAPGQNPTDTPNIVVVTDAGRESKKESKRNYACSHDIVRVVSQFLIARASLLADYTKGEHPRLQMRFLLRDRQFGMIDEPIFLHRDPNEPPKYARLTTDFRDIYLLRRSESTTNGPYDHYTLIIQNRMFEADLAAEDLDELVRTNTFSIEYEGRVFIAPPKGIQNLREFLQKELQFK